MKKKTSSIKGDSGVIVMVHTGACVGTHTSTAFEEGFSLKHVVIRGD